MSASLPPNVPEGSVLARFDCERDDIHDILEEYVVARISVPPGVMVWGRIGERWIPNANARPVVARLLALRDTLELDRSIRLAQGSVGPFPAEPSGPRWVARDGGGSTCPNGKPHEPRGMDGLTCKRCDAQLRWETGQ